MLFFLHFMSFQSLYSYFASATRANTQTTLRGMGPQVTQALACKQALRGALAAGREKEGELATTSREFEYLHQKCEMLIGGDNISNDVITHGACFDMFFKVCLHLHSLPLRADWRKSYSSVDREPQGNWRRNSNSRDVVASSPSFSRPAARAPMIYFANLYEYCIAAVI